MAATTRDAGTRMAETTVVELLAQCARTAKTARAA
jgi:hypothetical protein